MIAVAKRVSGVEWQPLVVFAKFWRGWGVIGGWHCVANVLGLIVLINCTNAESGVALCDFHKARVFDGVVEFGAFWKSFKNVIKLRD